MLSAFLKRLLFARQFFIINGKIEVLGVKQIMMPSDTILGLQNMDEKKSYDIIKKSSTENMRLFAKKLGASGEGLLKDIQDVYETFGLGAMEIVDLDQKKKRAIIRIRESPIAIANMQKSKRSSKVVCSSIAAVLSGAFTFLFNSNVDAVEKVCLAQGKDFCEFVIQSKKA